jgi:hypothetical protein
VGGVERLDQGVEGGFGVVERLLGVEVVQQTAATPISATASASDTMNVPSSSSICMKGRGPEKTTNYLPKR